MLLSTKHLTLDMVLLALPFPKTFAAVIASISIVMVILDLKDCWDGRSDACLSPATALVVSSHRQLIPCLKRLVRPA